MVYIAWNKKSKVEVKWLGYTKTKKEMEKRLKEYHAPKYVVPKQKKRVTYYAEGFNPSGEGYFKKRIAKKDIDFYKVRGYKITNKIR